LLAAGVVVAGVIGVSGVYPQVIDAEWMQGARTYASRTPAPDAKATTPDAKITRPSDVPASIQPPPRSTALVKGDAAVAMPGPAAAVATPRPAAVVATPRPAAPTSKPLPAEAEPSALADNPDAAASADTPPTPTVAAKSAAPVVKRRVSRAEHPRRGSPGPFAFGWGASPFRM
jgi:hypothetical protein